MLFNTPDLGPRDLAVLDEIERYRERLRSALRGPKRWTGNLRRHLMARAIRGSNSIEGYHVAIDDALAAVEEDDPMDADQATWAEIIGYRAAMTYIQQLAAAPHFRWDVTLLSSLHYMMLNHDLGKSPGQFRRGPIYVHDGEAGEIVYEGPDAERVPELVEALVRTLGAGNVEPLFVRAAMAHLNLVMIHPFRDGNGRMARALQTLVLARDGVLDPVFSSIEEYLGHGRNTTEYYAVLATVGGGRWRPQRDAAVWVRFNLRAHHIQAQTVLQRTSEASRLWAVVEELARREGLPDRSVTTLCNAALGMRVRRSTYEHEADVEPGTASRDLRVLTQAGLILAQGQTRGRRYAASDRLRDLYREVRATRPPIVEPYADHHTWLQRSVS